MILMEPKLISLREYSLSFNQLYNENFVSRNHLLDEIEDIANNDNKLIIIEGNEGIGKTNILLQFANRHNSTCFSYFINPACKFTAKQDFMMEDIGKQILFHLNSEVVDIDTIVNEGTFNNLLLNLLRAPGKKNKRLYFVIDGLDQIEKSENELLKPLLANLPWNTNNFNFIVSGNIEKLTQILPPQALKKSKTFRVIRYSYEEACKFFNWDDTLYAREVYETWNGNPERLSQVKRILETGIDIHDFLGRDDVREKNDLLEIEWKQSNIELLDFNSELVKLIRILAFDDNIRSLKKIISILTCDDANIEDQISAISFLTLKNDDLSFVSASYRQFAINKLKKFERKTFTLLIGFYTDQDDVSTVLNLPILYDKSQDWSSIITLLTVNNLGLIVTSSHSFADIKKQINYGYKASRSLKKAYEDIFRFSLYRSLINGLQKSDIRETQIEAYIALNKQDEAFSLISNAILKEDRLKMLVKYAKECKVQKIVVEPIIIKEIQDLLVGIDSDYLKENLVDIATGLAYFLPDLAVQVIEQASGLKSLGGSLEWLLNYIALIINKNSSDLTNDNITVSSDSSNKLSNTFVDKFAKSVGFGINEVPEGEIVENISKIENISDKLYITRAWIKKNSKAHNIAEIMEFAISLLLQSSSVVKPTTTTLLEIVNPLLLITNPNVIISFTKRIDELVQLINSPTNDKIRLNILVIESIAIFDLEDANLRIIDLYNEISALADYAIRVEAYADCLKLVKNLDVKLSDLKSEFILDEKDVKNDIIITIDILLLNIANHFNELENAIEIITRIDFDFAIDISHKLNTSQRRSEAVSKIVETHIEKDILDWDIDKIKKALHLIPINYHYVNSVVSIFDSANEQHELTYKHKQKIVELLPLINLHVGNDVKCNLLSKAIRLLSSELTADSNSLLKYDNLVNKLKGFLKQHWETIDNPVEKINLGYRLTSTFAKVDRSLSEELFKETSQLSDEYTIDNNNHLGAFIESIRLMIRIYVAIAAKDKDLSFEKISNLINHIPSNINKLLLWAELGVKVNLAGNKNTADEIVLKRINPIIDKYNNDHNNFYFLTALKLAAPAIHLSQPEALRLLIEKVPINDKERIISSVCFVSLTKIHESDSFNDIKGSSTFKYQDAIEFINLINIIETDYEIFHHIKNLCSVAKHFPNNFSREQKIEIKRRLVSLISNKLPNKKTGVNHEGYVIASKACILNFNSNNYNERLKEYEALEKEILNIPNNTDRCILYSIVAKECDIKKKKIELLGKAFDEADKVLAIKEKIDMYEVVLSECSSISSEIFSQYIEKIQTEILKLDEDDKFPTYRKLIDLAYKHDKQLAKRIISVVDTDPGRNQLSEPITDHFEHLELEKNVLDDYSQFGKIKNRRTMGKVAYRMLGELNSDTRGSRSLEQTITILHTASKLPFFQSLPLLEFFIQNCIKNDADNYSLLLSFYESAFSNAKLCYKLICSISNKMENKLSYENFDNESTFVARPGMRVQAMEFIEKAVRAVGSKNIYIIDPYFSQNDIQFIKDINYWSNQPELTILTSSEASGEFSRFSFLSAWKDLSSEEPPFSYFVKASNKENKSPFHDRWIIFLDKLQGLRIGTSINAIGGKKISEISMITETEVEAINESVIIPLIKQRVRNFGTEQTIRYETFEW